MLRRFIENVGNYFLFIKEVSLTFFFSFPRSKHIIQHIYIIGVESVWIVSIIALFTGMVIATNTYHQFKVINMENYTGSVVMLSMLSELGPVLTAIIIAARIGTSTAAEIASMKISMQLDALKSFGVSPLGYLVIPRVVGCALSGPILSAYANTIGFVGGYIICVLRYQIAPRIYIENSTVLLDSYDVFVGLIKALFFGLLISTLSSYIGFQSEATAEGVRKATTCAIVSCCILILISDFFLTALLL